MRIPSGKPQVARTIAELQRLRSSFAGQTVAFVPTMGALHEGHRSLIRLARRHADRVVVSIFVNPLQFGPGEDYARYPRVLEHDLAACVEEGVDLVFVPGVRDLYPPGRQILIGAGQMGAVLEGAARPGHFDGVLTVVLKLFNVVRPDRAIFGEKDAQQLACIRRMVIDLNVTVDILGGPTVREPDGLALSSRNRFLSKPERSSALALSASLRSGAEQTCAPEVVSAARGRLTEAERDDPAFRLDYVALVHPTSFVEVPADHTGEAILAVAAQVGTTRLIDNVTVDLVGQGGMPRSDD
ncbi:MAG TPA: pantoate--beta-alanine ligase [Propionibacteriaceae bacterium]|nr:pantoate--beta-alanine ligase [Propionibacteriaceae bacterium]